MSDLDPSNAAAAGDPETPPVEVDDAPPAAPAPDFQPITSQEEFQKKFDKIFGQRWAAEQAKYKDYADLQAKAKQFDEWQQSQKDQATLDAEEKAALLKRIEEFEKRESDRAFEDMRAEVASAANLPAHLAKRLQGSTREELEADAAELAETLPPPPASPPPAPSGRPTPLNGGGNPTPEPAGPSFNPAEIAARLRSVI